MSEGSQTLQLDESFRGWNGLRGVEPALSAWGEPHVVGRLSGYGSGVRLLRQTYRALRRDRALNLQDAITDDRLAVTLVEVAGRAGE